MKANQIPPTPVRLPDDLKSWVKRRAEVNHRSVNGEIITILAKERNQDSGQERASDADGAGLATS